MYNNDACHVSRRLNAGKVGSSFYFWALNPSPNLPLALVLGSSVHAGVAMGISLACPQDPEHVSQAVAEPGRGPVMAPPSLKVCLDTSMH